jgi:recombination protein RecA
VKVVKNKCAPPFQEAEFDIIYNQGISRAGEVIDMGTALGLIEKSGSYFTLGDQNLQGRAAAIEHLRQNPALLEELAARVTAAPRPALTKPAQEAA